jgi:hypothetical protein
MVNELIAKGMALLHEDSLPFALGIVFANEKLHPAVGFTLANAIRETHGERQVAVASISNAVKAWVQLMLIPKNNSSELQKLAERSNAVVVSSGLQRRAIEAQEWANAIPRAFYLQADSGASLH